MNSWSSKLNFDRSYPYTCLLDCPQNMGVGGGQIKKSPIHIFILFSGAFAAGRRIREPSNQVSLALVCHSEWSTQVTPNLTL